MSKTYPWCLYNAIGDTLVVHSQEQELAAGPSWQFNPDRSPVQPAPDPEPQETAVPQSRKRK